MDVDRMEPAMTLADVVVYEVWEATVPLVFVMTYKQNNRIFFYKL